MDNKEKKVIQAGRRRHTETALPGGTAAPKHRSINPARVANGHHPLAGLAEPGERVAAHFPQLPFHFHLVESFH